MTDINGFFFLKLKNSVNDILISIRVHPSNPRFPCSILSQQRFVFKVHILIIFGNGFKKIKRLAMKKIYTLCLAFVLLVISANAQLLTWTPAFPKDNDNITVTVDATKGNQGLNNYTPVSDVFVHIGVITNLSTGPSNWRYVPFTWATTPPAAQATSLGGNKWQFTINNIRNFFAVPAGETILRIAILFRNGSGSVVQRNGDGSDMYIPVYDNNLAVRFSVPPYQPYYNAIPEPISKQVGDNINVTGIASQTSDMKLYLNGTVIQSNNGVTSISANPLLSTSGNTEIVVEATASSVTKKDTLRFFVAQAINIAPLPAGVRDGINYGANNTEVTLVLNAPNKNRISVIGEFPGSNWVEQNNYVMNKTADGKYWWLKITGLTPGTEYAFQYLVDGTLRIGEPYAEKILDQTFDFQIPASTYPNLKQYPAGFTTGIVSIVQTNAPAYNWAVNNFSRPDKRNLVIYEMLLRDFLAAHDWKTLKDTLSHFKTLGINAIQLMPFNEFESNESWGYNPDYYLAPDKYYGPKNTLKELVDSCHKNGIAVIMDIALNHATGQCPLAALYWNAAAGTPAANNPWFNVSATHPYNVFNDFNHESLDTRYFTSRVIEHWLTEYKLDGFRWDLSKGFTQNTQCGGSTSNEACIAAYHADRVAIWKRYYDTMQLKSSGSYCILEHFCDNTEEMELSDYGMMLWGNTNYNFSEASMGWVGTSNFESYLHTSRGWNRPHLVGYMESHDEERMMYRNLQFGNNSNASYNIRDLNTALKRIELCASFFLMGPGPKMIWEFGELGYDFSINRCLNGTIDNNCRLDPKPIRWDYKTVVQRKRLYDIFSSLNKLRFHGWYKDVFTANNITLTKSMTGAVKTLIIRSATDSSMMVVVGNFDVNAQIATVNFPAPGTWYDYLGGNTFTAGPTQPINLQPGEYHVYLNRNLINAVVTGVGNTSSSDGWSASVYPNPAINAVLEVNAAKAGWADILLMNETGQQVKNLYGGMLIKGKNTLTVQDKLKGLPSGVYFAKVQTATKTLTVKMIIP